MSRVLSNIRSIRRAKWLFSIYRKLHRVSTNIFCKSTFSRLPKFVLKFGQNKVRGIFRGINTLNNFYKQNDILSRKNSRYMACSIFRNRSEQSFRNLVARFRTGIACWERDSYRALSLVAPFGCGTLGNELSLLSLRLHQKITVLCWIFLFSCILRYNHSVTIYNLQTENFQYEIANTESSSWISAASNEEKYVYLKILILCSSHGRFRCSCVRWCLRANTAVP